MKLIFLILSNILVLQGIFSQLNTITNERVFGGLGHESVNKSFIDHDGNKHIFSTSNSNAGFSKSENSRGENDLWVLKLDENNNKLWDRTIGGDGFDLVDDVVFLNEYFYVALSSSSNVSGEKTEPNFAGVGNSNSFDIWLLCIDMSGEIIWQKTYGGSGVEHSVQMAIINNNNLILSTFSTSPISGNKEVGTIGKNDIWLLEISPSNGDIINQHSYPSNKMNGTYSLSVNPESGDFYITFLGLSGTDGIKTDPGYAGACGCLLVLDNNYTVKQQKCFGGDQSTDFRGVNCYSNSDKLYYVCAESSNVSGNKTVPSFGSTDIWIVKMDLDLNILWDKVYGGDRDEYLRKFEIAENRLKVASNSLSSTVQAGNKNSTGFGHPSIASTYDTWYFETDLDGNILTQVTIGAVMNEYGFFAQNLSSETSKITYLARSESSATDMKTVQNFGSFPYSFDIWLFDFEESELNVSEINLGSYGLHVYPNPFADGIHFTLPKGHSTCELKIFTLDGKQIYQETIPAFEESWKIKLDASVNSIYFYEIVGDNYSFSGKLVKK